MIDCINNNSWISELGIKDNIASKILNNVPLRRFRKILRIQGVGKQTYFDLFKYSYHKAISLENNLLKSNQAILQSKPEKIDNTNNEITQIGEEHQLIENKEQKYRDKTIPSFNNFDTFDLIWPYLEQKLKSEQKKDQLVDFFKVRKVQMDDWLKKGMDMGKVKKLTKPVRYVLSSDKENKLPLLEYMDKTTN